MAVLSDDEIIKRIELITTKNINELHTHYLFKFKYSEEDVKKDLKLTIENKTCIGLMKHLIEHLKISENWLIGKNGNGHEREIVMENNRPVQLWNLTEASINQLHEEDYNEDLQSALEELNIATNSNDDEESLEYNSKVVNEHLNYKILNTTTLGKNVTGFPKSKFSEYLDNQNSIDLSSVSMEDLIKEIKFRLHVNDNIVINGIR